MTRLTLLPSGEYLRHHKGFEHGFQGVNLMGQKVPIYHALSGCKPVKHKSMYKICWYIYLQIKSYSLSKCSNYPLFIFLCPKIESKQYPWKKPNTLNYPNSIRENLAMSQTFSMFFKNIAKFKNLCFLLHKIFSILVFFTT